MAARVAASAGREVDARGEHRLASEKDRQEPREFRVDRAEALARGAGIGEWLLSHLTYHKIKPRKSQGLFSPGR